MPSQPAAAIYFRLRLLGFYFFAYAADVTPLTPPLLPYFHFFRRLLTLDRLLLFMPHPRAVFLKICRADRVAARHVANHATRRGARYGAVMMSAVKRRSHGTVRC